MARANTIQTNFTSGELSPNMWGRVDVTKYFNGARTLKNMISLPQGGARRVPGSIYLGTVHDSTRKTVVRRFQFSKSDSYVIEFGHQTIRIWQSRATVGAPLVVTSPYDEDDVHQLKFTQSADVLFIAHPDYYPRTLTRVSHTSWTLAAYDNEDGPYMSETPEVDVTLSNVLDRATATASSSTFALTGSAKTITNVTAVSSSDPSIKITATAHGFSENTFILIKGVVGVPECLGTWYIHVLDADNFQLYASRKLATTTYASGGTAQEMTGGGCVEFQEDNLWKLARVTDITSGTVAEVDVIDEVLRPDPTIKLTYDGAVTTQAAGNVGVFSWYDVYKAMRPNAFAGVQDWVIMYQYYDSINAYTYRAGVLNFGDATKSVVITGRAITATMTASAAYFAATDVGRHVRLNYGAQWVRGTITAYTSSTVVTVTLEDEVPFDTSAPYQLYNGGKTQVWKIGAWSSTTGYPSAVAFHQDRLVWYSTAAEPSTKWFTKTGDYYTFEPSNPDDSIVGDDNGIAVRMVSRQVNRGVWMDSGPVLLSGTEGAEWQIKPSSIQQVLTPTNYSATIQTTFGSFDLESMRAGTHTLFIERSGLKLRELTYDFSLDSFVAKDLSILSEHILRENGGVVDWTMQTSPYNLIWIVLGNGKVAVVTYEYEHEVVAWTLCDLGGIVESVCASNTTDGEDEVYMVVRRTLNGSSVRCVEVVQGIMDNQDSYMNCSKVTSFGGVGVSYCTGLTHLIGETVGVSVDGVYIGSQTVDGSGRVHVGYIADKVAVGLLNEAIVEILDPDGGSQAGTSQAKKKRITESAARVINTYYFQVASAAGSTDATESLSANVEIDDADWTRLAPTPTLGAQSSPGNVGTVVPLATFELFTGDVSFSVDDAFDNGGRFQICTDEPYPLNITALMHKLNTNE